MRHRSSVRRGARNSSKESCLAYSPSRKTVAGRYKHVENMTGRVMIQPLAIVRPDPVDPRRGWLEAGSHRRWPCALGRSGVRLDKHEGDGATPVGDWPIRRILYRADRVTLPNLPWPISVIQPQDGWCDDPGDRRYNQSVTFPFSASAERMWRDDGVYDVVVVLGYNDAPPTPGRGSAIFLHLARPGLTPTEGCIALDLPHLIELLALGRSEASIRVEQR